MKILRPIVIFIIFIGIISIAINMVFPNTSTYLQLQGNGYITYYTFDFARYFEKINAQIRNYDELVLQLPIREWNNDIINDILLIVDYLIMVINVILYPIRIGAYITRIMLTLLGIDVINPNKAIAWLVEFINNGVRLAIPYTLMPE